MYSTQLFQYLADVSQICGVDSEKINLLQDSMKCYVAILAELLGAQAGQLSDPLRTSVQLLLLDDGITAFDVKEPAAEAAHYLIGLGHEQIGALAARTFEEANPEQDPLLSDYWYRLLLATLHYLAGGHRVQALGAIRALERLGAVSAPSAETSGYAAANDNIRRLHASEPLGDDASNRWSRLLSGQVQSADSVTERRIARLAGMVRKRRDITLEHLGFGDESNWLASRSIFGEPATNFWRRYVSRLKVRGITTFTREQVGDGFDQWLRSDRDMLIVLPTGSGKTILGELRTALSLAEGKQAVWMLPTRAMVRQTKRELRNAFSGLGKLVTELPVSEDARPQFIEAFNEEIAVAVTTPERMAALMRGNADAASQIGVVILDEAHILLKETRAETAEFVLRAITEQVPGAHLVLMTAFSEALEPLRRIMEELGRVPLVLHSDHRPARQMYGVLVPDIIHGKRHPLILLYPPGLYDGLIPVPKPYSIAMLNVNAPKSLSKASFASRVAQQCMRAGLKTLIFLGTKASVEAQSVEISQKQPVGALPTEDLARLGIEYGEESPIQSTARYGVAPHHGALSRLEQHMVEKWIRTGELRAITATPTLAEGVNLPLDVSLVASTSRYNPDTGKSAEIPQEELLNMLGRAGRAGYAGDGLCLIVEKKGLPETIYQRRRRTFFPPSPPVTHHLGMGRLLTLATHAKVGNTGWAGNLAGMQFAQAQSLLSSVATVLVKASSSASALTEYFESFPSVRSLDQGELENSISELLSLSEDLSKDIGEDAMLLEALSRTGLPLKVLRLVRDQLADVDADHDTSSLIEWSVNTITEILASCKDHDWHLSLLGKHMALDTKLGTVILAWMNGEPVSSVISASAITLKPARKRLAVIDFLNHGLSLLSQFWGALAVWQEQSLPQSSNELTQRLARMPAYVREGVTSLPELVWLREMGGLDRVLAHAVAPHSFSYETYREQRDHVRHQLRQYRQNPATIPISLSAEQRLAISGILAELNTT